MRAGSVRAALGCALLALCLAPAWAQAPAPFKLVQLAPGVYAAIDQGGRAGANAGVVIGEQAIAVIDSFFRPEATQALVAEVRKLSPLPLRYLINTHHHIDHVAGNALIEAEGAVLIGHRHVPQWIVAENLRLMGGDKVSPAVRERVQGLRAPRLLLDQSLEVDLGGRRLLLRHLPGHSGGDLIVSVPETDVVFMGDLFWNRSLPNLTDARVADWIVTLEGVAASAGAGLRFVPGHGEVGAVQELRAFGAYLQDLSRLTDETLGLGLSAEATRERLQQALAERYRDWAYFAGLSGGNVRDMLAERSGAKRVPLPAP